MGIDHYRNAELTDELRKAWGQYMAYPATQAALGEIVRRIDQFVVQIASMDLYTEEDVRKAMDARGTVRGLRNALDILEGIGKNARRTE